MEGMNVGSSVGGGGTSSVQLRHEHRGGSAGDDRRRAGGGGARRPGVQHHSEDRRQHVPRQLLRQLRRRVVAGQQYRRRAGGPSFTDGAQLIKSWDTNFTLDGPIVKDKLWFFGNIRTVGTYQDQPRIYANANAGYRRRMVLQAGPERKGAELPIQPRDRRPCHLAGDTAEQARLSTWITPRSARDRRSRRTAASAGSRVTAGRQPDRGSGQGPRRIRRSRAPSGTIVRRSPRRATAHRSRAASFSKAHGRPSGATGATSSPMAR